jgi:hypothetical protein
MSLIRAEHSPPHAPTPFMTAAYPMSSLADAPWLEWFPETPSASWRLPRLTDLSPFVVHHITRWPEHLTDTLRTR